MSCRPRLTDVVDGPTAARDAPPPPAVGRSRRLMSWVRDEACRLAQIAVRVRDALHRSPAPQLETTTDDASSPAEDGSTEHPRWGVVATGLVIAGGLLALRLSAGTALYW